MIKTMIAIALAAGCAIGGANAQSFPSRPVTILVPLAAGGSTDTIARIIAEGMRPHLGQPVIVENSPGAGGSTGVIRVARSAPDGYIVQIGQWGTNVASGAVYDLPIDLLKDLEPVGADLDAAVHDRRQKDLPAEQSQGADRLAQGQLRQGHGRQRRHRQPGPCLQHVLPEHHRRQDPASSRTAAPARRQQDLVAGQIDLMMDTRGDLRRAREATACSRPSRSSANKRSPAMPDVPTVDEAGLPGFYFYFWHAMWVPKGTPKDVIAKLNDALVKARNDPATHKRLADIGQEFFPADMETPEALAKFQKEEIDKWWPVIKAAGIKAQ